jgi:hypothetical protein
LNGKVLESNSKCKRQNIVDRPGSENRFSQDKDRNEKNKPLRDDVTDRAAAPAMGGSYRCDLPKRLFFPGRLFTSFFCFFDLMVR